MKPFPRCVFRAWIPFLALLCAALVGGASPPAVGAELTPTVANAEAVASPPTRTASVEAVGLAWRPGLPLTHTPSRYRVQALLRRTGCSLLLSAVVDLGSSLPSSPLLQVAPMRFSAVGAEFGDSSQNDDCKEDRLAWQGLEAQESLLAAGFPPVLLLTDAHPETHPGRQVLLLLLAQTLAPGLPTTWFPENPSRALPREAVTSGTLPSGPSLGTASLDPRGKTLRMAATGSPGDFGATLGADSFALAWEARKKDGGMHRAIASLLAGDVEVARVEVEAMRVPRSLSVSGRSVAPLAGALETLTWLRHLAPGTLTRALSPDSASLSTQREEAALTRSTFLARLPLPDDSLPQTLRGTLLATASTMAEAAGQQDAAIRLASQAALALQRDPRQASLHRSALLASCWGNLPPQSPEAAVDRALRGISQESLAGVLELPLTSVPDELLSSFTRGRLQKTLCPGPPVPMEGGAFLIPLAEPGDPPSAEALVLPGTAGYRPVWLPVPGGPSLLLATAPHLVPSLLAAASRRGEPTPCTDPGSSPSLHPACLALVAGVEGAAFPDLPEGPSPSQQAAFAVHDAWTLLGSASLTLERIALAFPEGPSTAPPSVLQAGVAALAELHRKDQEARSWAEEALRHPLPLSTTAQAGLILCQEGRTHPGAASSLLNSLSLSPGDEAVLSSLLACTGDGRDEAPALARVARRALTLSPSVPAALLHARSLNSLGQGDAALDFLYEFEALINQAKEEPDERVGRWIASLRAQRSSFSSAPAAEGAPPP